MISKNFRTLVRLCLWFVSVLPMIVQYHYICMIFLITEETDIWNNDANYWPSLWWTLRCLPKHIDCVVRIYVGVSCLVKRNPSSGEPWKSQDEGLGEKKGYSETQVRLDGYGMGRREDLQRRKWWEEPLLKRAKKFVKSVGPHLFAKARQLWLRPIPSPCCVGSFHFLFVYVCGGGAVKILVWLSFQVYL